MTPNAAAALSRELHGMGFVQVHAVFHPGHNRARVLLPIDDIGLVEPDELRKVAALMEEMGVTMTSDFDYGSAALEFS